MFNALANIPAPDYRNRELFESGYNGDLIKVLNAQFPAAVSQCAKVHFSGATATDKARAIYNYLRGSVRYKKDSEKAQYIQLPARLLHDTKAGDCKSLALAAAAFMY